MIAVIGIAWIGARAALWESPLAPSQASLASAETHPNKQSSEELISAFENRYSSAGSKFDLEQVIEDQDPESLPLGAIVRVPVRTDVIRVALKPDGASPHSSAKWAAFADDNSGYSSMAHAILWREAMAQSGRRQPHGVGYNRIASTTSSPTQGSSPTAPETPSVPNKADRWAVDSWSFFRQGSDTAPISQGRVPTYGASQAGAKLTYRLAPKSAHDPRVFVRAYSALIANGENELAVGGSARLFAKVPIRLAGEVRYTDSLLGKRFRPAAYAFTEIPPISLPERFSLEAYAQGGYVAGSGSTFFADGQAVATREVKNFTAGRLGNARFSIGAGAWGGAQKGVYRVDVGPTMRVDMSIGKVPARISVDWRQKIAGDAAPESGVAATISTRF
ncbi:MAG: hypothetical protein AAGK17_03370 [Pseudomonadota bacterium]